MSETKEAKEFRRKMGAFKRGDLITFKLDDPYIDKDYIGRGIVKEERINEYAHWLLVEHYPTDKRHHQVCFVKESLVEEIL